MMNLGRPGRGGAGVGTRLLRSTRAQAHGAAFVHLRALPARARLFHARYAPRGLIWR